ncbi:MAG: hypothetical protein IKP68_05150 [Clostridia bacterium]|nr:hypothetical protein [Clostridia bacterium]
MEWIFDGIGSTIIGAILGLIIGGIAGGFIGYKNAIKNKIKQSQKAKNDSTQEQVGNITIINQNGDINKNGK